MNSEKERGWRRLDNAAKIFPPNVSSHDTKVFRFACELKELVEPAVLQQAMEDTLELFPIFRAVMKQGLFWCYLEESRERPLVTEENLPPCTALYDPTRRNLLFRVTYYKRRINLEIFHAVTDGTGALQFLCTMVSRYLQLAHRDVLPEMDLADFSGPTEQQEEDSFLKYYDPNQKPEKVKKERAYRVKGAKLPEGRLQVIEGVMSVKQVLAQVKARQVTMSVFLTALFLQAIGEEMPVRYRNKPVVSAVPVNLRNFFPSGTVRNFFGLINVGYNFSKGSGKLDDIMAEVKRQFEEQLTKEKLAARIGQMASLERNPMLRIVPWAVKNRALRVAHQMAQRYSTTSISNLGRIAMMPGLTGYIQRFDVFVSTERPQICLCSFGDQLTISTSSSFCSTQIQARFFRQLTEMGIDVEIVSNLQEEEDA